MYLPRLTVLEDQYAIGRVLDTDGPFEITYQAWNLQTEDQVVMKEFFPVALVERDEGTTEVLRKGVEEEALFGFGLEQFIKEALALAELKHPNLVRELEHFLSNGTAYRVEEHHAGAALDAVLKKQGGRLPSQTAVTILVPILDGLQAVHEKGLLHGGISASSILLAKNGRPMLRDFHTSRILMAQRTQSLPALVKGGFAAPELYAKDGEQGPWTDIYGCGATLYHMITGLVLPPASEAQQDEVTRLVESSDSIPPAIKDVLVKALSIDHTARPGKVEEFQQILVDAAKESKSFAPIAQPKTESKQPRAESRVEALAPEPTTTAGSAEPAKPEATVKPDPKKTASKKATAPEAEKAPVAAAVPKAEQKRQSRRKAADRPAVASESKKKTPVLAAFAAIVLVAFIGGYMLMQDDGDATQFAHFKVKGDSLFNLGNYTDARDQYEQALTVRADTEVSQKLTTVNQKIAKVNDGEYMQQLTIGDERMALADSLREAGNALDAMNAYAEANKAYFEALRFRPNDVVALEKGQLSSEAMNMAYAQGRDAEAEAQAEEQDPEAVRRQLYENYRDQGDRLYRQGNYLAAQRKYREALEYKPNDRYASNRLNEIENAVSEAELEEEFAQLIEQGTTLCDQDRCAEAKLEFEKALALKPDNQLAKDGIARANRVLAQKQEQNDRYQYFRGQGDMQMSQGSYDAAIASYQNALEYKPGDEYITRKIAESEQALASSAQEAEQPASNMRDGVYLIAEEAPQLIGGLDGLHRKVRYPEAAYRTGVEGRVYVQFVVDERGRVQNPELMRGIGAGCDEEAMRVISQARFEPGKVGGEPVKVQHTLYIRFEIQD